MATSYGALCTDFYINHKVSLKMDLPGERETILHLFDQIKRICPSMDRFRRFDSEVLLESSRKDPSYQWASLRRSSIRAGYVNPDAMTDATRFHTRLLELVPYHLTISPLDVDHAELTFGFDLECKGNHDDVVFEALLGETPLADLLKIEGAKPMDVQPFIGAKLASDEDVQVFFEVRTRRRSRRGGSSRYRDEPISIFLMVRRFNPISTIDQWPQVFGQMVEQAEQITTDHVVPSLLTPIARQITSGSA